MNKLRLVASAGLLAAALALAGPALSQTAASSAPPQRVDTPPAPGTSEDVIVKPGEKRAEPPDGDPRSYGELQRDQMAWDRCLVSAPESDMAHPVESTPEEYCSRRLGMADRNAIPNSISNPRGQRQPR